LIEIDSFFLTIDANKFVKTPKKAPIINVIVGNNIFFQQFPVRNLHIYDKN
jgi:hypothetical protein